MEHSFDIEIAKLYGIDCAIVYKHILFWIIKNKAHNKNFYDGSYWTYFSISSLQNIFPYFTVKQLRNIIDKLKEKNIIKIGNHNAQKYDRTLWYAFVNEPKELQEIVPTGVVQKGKSICPKGQMEVPEMANGIAQKGEPIPYTNTNIITDNKDIILREKGSKRFVKPTIEQIKAYSKEINAGIDAEQFYYWYEAKGWMIGKNKMKDWRASVRTWKRKKETDNTATEFLRLGRE